MCVGSPPATCSFVVLIKFKLIAIKLGTGIEFGLIRNFSLVRWVQKLTVNRFLFQCLTVISILISKRIKHILGVIVVFN